MLSFLSPIRLRQNSTDIDSKYYPELDAQDGLGKTDSTNESGLRYVMNSLKQKGRKLDYYVCLTSDITRNNVLRNDVDGNPETHLDYFKKRTTKILEKYYPGQAKKIEDFLIDVPYNEKAGMEDYLTSVLMVINEIRNLQKNDEYDDIVIHLDLTGGPRDANMLLLIITRMFAYDKSVIVRNVVYSNILRVSSSDKVNEDQGSVQLVTDAYHLLDLVSGVAEFINFGSMASLNRYYALLNANMKSKELDDFIAAMNDFSNRVILCRYRELKRSLVRLQETIGEFENRVEALKDNDPLDAEDAKDRNKYLSVVEQLMFGFLAGFKKKYELLFNCNPNDTKYDLKLIRWCYENNYLQQGMTIITERIPGYLLDKGIIRISDEERQKAREGIAEYNKNKKNHPVEANNDIEFSYWYLTNSVSGITIDINSFKTKAGTAIKECFTAMRKKRPFVEMVSYELDKFERKFNCDGKYNRDVIIKNLEQFASFISTIQLNETVPMNEEIYIDKVLRSVIPDYSEMQLTDILKRVSEDKTLQMFELTGGCFEEKYLKKYSGDYFEKMIKVEYGQIQSDYDSDLLLKALLLYYEIKEERNAANHAHDKEEKITLEELKNKIYTLIVELESIENE